MRSKIKSIEELGKISLALKNDGKKIVHCHGVFDLIHPGHIKHFQAARKFGDVLIVTITDDKHVNKGPGRPIFNEDMRAENIAAITFVDYVAINFNLKAIPVLEIIQPNFYVKGQDYKVLSEDITGGIYEEKSKVEEFGGELVFTEEIQFSSSKLINSHIKDDNSDIKPYLENLRRITSYEKLKESFEQISKLNVLVIGDIILDEYQFVRTIGKASKSNAITSKRLDSELYAGGILAIANHISNFVNSVNLVSTYGNNFGTDYYDFISSKLNRNVKFSSVSTPDRPTVLKKRFVDNVFKSKLFEIIEIEDEPLSNEQKSQLIKEIDTGIYDIIVVGDFGHGLIDNEIAEHIINKKVFTSINTQTNSANLGYNLITKYSHCDYFSIDENEARLATHDRHSSIEQVFSKLIKLTKTNTAAITLGINGSITGSNGDLVNSPVLSHGIVDTIGAGDAFLSISSLLAKNGNSLDEIAFVGNAVGAIAVKILGNKSYIERTPLLKYLKTLLA